MNQSICRFSFSSSFPLLLPLSLPLSRSLSRSLSLTLSLSLARARALSLGANVPQNTSSRDHRSVLAQGYEHELMLHCCVSIIQHLHTTVYTIIQQVLLAYDYVHTHSTLTYDCVHTHSTLTYDYAHTHSTDFTSTPTAVSAGRTLM